MESAESQIKERIIQNYGSLKKFCEIINMPWTTLDSILKRGFANSNITNIMKISHELRVDTESLASGNIVGCDEIFSTKTREFAKEPSPKIIQYYEQLNDVGKHVATERVKELAEVPRYVKEGILYVNAAHADNYMDAPAEWKQLEEDIMDDENF